MSRIPFAAALAGLAFLPVHLATAGPAYSQPPAIPGSSPGISADLTAPWVIQLKRGKRIALSNPKLTRAVARPAPPAPARAYGRAIDAAFLPRTVSYATDQPTGTVIIDTGGRYLYLVIGPNRAKRYGVGVGRPGFEWAGVHTVTRKAEWPDWVPPEQMRRREPTLPVAMEGGQNNPLGARALYLGSTLYRIHGSNQPWTIGHAVSSGCIRMRNEDVIDLYERVAVGAKVIVI